MDDQTGFEKSVIERIKESGLSLAALAAASGVARDALSKFVGGKAGMSSGSIGKVIDHLGLVLRTKKEAMVSDSARAGVCARWVEGCYQGQDVKELNYLHEGLSKERFRLTQESMDKKVEDREKLLRRAVVRGKTVEEVKKQDSADRLDYRNREFIRLKQRGTCMNHYVPIEQPRDVGGCYLEPPTEADRIYCKKLAEKKWEDFETNQRFEDSVHSSLLRLKDRGLIDSINPKFIEIVNAPASPGKRSIMAFVSQIFDLKKCLFLSREGGLLDTKDEDLGKIQWIAALSPEKAYKAGKRLNYTPKSKLASVLVDHATFTAWVDAIDH